MNLLFGAVFVVTLTLFIAGQFRSEERPAEKPERFSQSARDVPIPIEVYEYGLNPTNTVIKVGQAVAFKNVGKELHEIRPASPAGEAAFEEAQQLGSSRPVFREPGVYPIYCAIHPGLIRGTITVKEKLPPLRVGEGK